MGKDKKNPFAIHLKEVSQEHGLLEKHNYLYYYIKNKAEDIKVKKVNPIH
jgi:hypothetical protein